MGRKTVNKTVKPIVDVDSLVNEGRNIDMDKVNEVIAESEKKQEEEAKAVEEKVEEKVEEITEETNFIQVAETNEEPIEEKELVVEDAASSTVKETEEENIDDVIAECTGESEEFNEDIIDFDGGEEEVCEDTTLHLKKKKEQPWYVARAMRGNDYFSW